MKPRFPDYSENDYLWNEVLIRGVPLWDMNSRYQEHVWMLGWIRIDSDKGCDSGGVTKRVTTVQLFRR